MQLPQLAAEDLHLPVQVVDVDEAAEVLRFRLHELVGDLRHVRLPGELLQESNKSRLPKDYI